MSRAMMWPSNWDCRLKSTESKLWESALPVYNNSWAGVCTSYGETDGSQRSPCWSRSGREAVHGKSCCSCKRSRGGARGDSPLLGFGKSSWDFWRIGGIRTRRCRPQGWIGRLWFGRWHKVIRQVSCPINRSPDWLVIRGARFPALWIMPAMSSGVQEGSSFPLFGHLSGEWSPLHVHPLTLTGQAWDRPQFPGQVCLRWKSRQYWTPLGAWSAQFWGHPLGRPPLEDLSFLPLPLPGLFFRW